MSIVVQTWEKKTAMMQKWQRIPSRFLSPSCSLRYGTTAFLCVGEKDRYPDGTAETSLQVGKRVRDKRYSCGRGDNALRDHSYRPGRGGRREKATWRRHRAEWLPHAEA